MPDPNETPDIGPESADAVPVDAAPAEAGTPPSEDPDAPPEPEAGARAAADAPSATDTPSVSQDESTHLATDATGADGSSPRVPQVSSETAEEGGADAPQEDSPPDEDSPPTDQTDAAEDDTPGEGASIASATPVPVEPRTWREIGADLIRPGRPQVVLAVILMLCGLAVTMQITAQHDQRYSTLRQDELVAVLDDVSGETRRLEAEIADLERTRDQLASGADADAVARAEAHRRLDALELLGGTVPARGPGIRITITDPRGKLTPEILLNAIEELRDAGAEVMAVGDHRLVASSSVTSSSSGDLQVDGKILPHPLVIVAIGDRDTLAEATRFRGGLVSTIEGDRVGGSVIVTKLDTLDITATVTPKTMRFARPV